jgi:hypothetical protein
MEEILAAIKHIMAEEGGLPPEPVVVSAPPARVTERPPEPVSLPEPMKPEFAVSSPAESASLPPFGAVPPSAIPSPRLPPVQDAILDLTERVDDDEPVTAHAHPPATATPTVAAAPNPAPSPAGRLTRPPPLKAGTNPAEASGAAGGKRIVAESTLAASVAALSQIATVAASNRQQELPLGDIGRTLEEMVRELLRPHLKEWLDAHLSRLVERLVRDEISRLVREVQDR